jgi:hypothetical protein
MTLLERFNNLAPGRFQPYKPGATIEDTLVVFDKSASELDGLWKKYESWKYSEKYLAMNPVEYQKYINDNTKDQSTYKHIARELLDAFEDFLIKNDRKFHFNLYNQYTKEKDRVQVFDHFVNTLHGRGYRVSDRDVRESYYSDPYEGTLLQKMITITID